MRATPRITWLLLSLSFLFDGVCPDAEASSSVSQGPAADVQNASTVKTPLHLGNVTTKTAVTVNSVTNGVTVSPITASTLSSAASNIGATDKVSTSTNPQMTVTASKTATAVTKVNPTQPTVVVVTEPTKPIKPNATVPGISIPVPYTPPSKPNVITMTSKVSSSDSTESSSRPSAKPSTGPSARPTTARTLESTATNQDPAILTKLLAVPSSKAPLETTKGTTNPSVTTEQGRRTHVAFIPSVTQASSNKGISETLPTRHGPTPFHATMPPGNAESTSAPNIQTKHPPTVDAKVQTKAPQTTAVLPTTIVTTIATAAPTFPKKFIYSLLSEQETKEEEDLAKVCKLLMPNWQNGTCTLTWRHHNGKVQFDLVEINGKVKTSQAAQYYEEITKKPSDNRTLIAILASCGALLIMIVILAVCASHHRKPYHENQQHLTEELHTVENGYHDNPTLEVMEVQPEMQEKKVALNGEFNDSWIVPMDNLLKEELPDEEDTHL